MAARSYAPDFALVPVGCLVKATFHGTGACICPSLYFLRPDVQPRNLKKTTRAIMAGMRGNGRGGLVAVRASNT